MPGIFLGVKCQAHVFFWVHNMKLRRTPPSCILQVPFPRALLSVDSLVPLLLTMIRTMLNSKPNY